MTKKIFFSFQNCNYDKTSSKVECNLCKEDYVLVISENQCYDKNYLDIIGKIISILYEKYKNEFENYYSLLIQKDISIIKGDDEDYNQYNKIFLLFIKNNEIS